MKKQRINLKHGLIILGIAILLLSLFSIIVSAENPVGNALNSANSIFTGGLKPYSKLIDFFVFFTIFTTVTLIGLKAMYKDKGSTRQIVALSIAIGIMSSLALMYGGTFLGKEITTATLFPYALGFLIFIVILLPLYFIINKLTGEKHKIISFFIALLITAILMFFIMGGLSKLKIPFLSRGGTGSGGSGGTGGGQGATFSKTIKGFFYVGESQEFADSGGNKLDNNAELKRINDFASNCKKANVVSTATMEWKSESDTNKRIENNFNLAKARCEYIKSLLEGSGVSVLNACEKGDYVSVINTEYPSDRYYKATCTEQGKNDGGGSGGGSGTGGGGSTDDKKTEKQKSCRQLVDFNVDNFFSEIIDQSKNTWKQGGQTKLQKLKAVYDKCHEDWDESDPDSTEDFQKAAWNYYSLGAKSWFTVGDYDKAQKSLFDFNVAVSDINTEVNAPVNPGYLYKDNPYRAEITKLWYDDLIAGDMKEILKEIKSLKDENEKINKMTKFNRKLKVFEQGKVKSSIYTYSRP
ncbi:TPA: hypothetical protein HA246_05185 [Candidatus Woesearchaeota archaeon]|nr:hypothetical protein [Candidatus Woesearchaeota archaeon]